MYVHNKKEKYMRIGILGYGNLGRGVEYAVKQNSDMELVAIFTRRKPEELKTNSGAVVISVSEIEQWKNKIDVLIICSGSANDLPVQTPEYAKMFNVVDSFDTHAKIPAHFTNVDNAAKEGGNVAMISVGWDPGMFSLNRVYANAILPEGKDYTFWGKGISQGHSDAIRRIDGVKDAKGERISTIYKSQIKELKDSGVLYGGMLPKIDCAATAITGGTKKAHILDGRIKHCLLLEIFTDSGIGTQILND